MKTRGRVQAELLIVVILLSLVLPVRFVCAEMYKWIDSEGTLHVTTDPPVDENAKILSRSEDAGAVNIQENPQKAEIDKHLKFWREQLEYHTGLCLKRETEAHCNRNAEIDRKKIAALQTNSELYFAHVKKYGLVTSHFPD